MSPACSESCWASWSDIQAYHLVLEGFELPSVGENVRAWVKEHDDDLRAVVLTMSERSLSGLGDPGPPDARDQS